MTEHAGLQALVARDRYPRSTRYDASWVVENRMGPNVLWLAEALTDVLRLEPGMRVLDLGCGRAISSIFLAREFEVEVWATDLWIAPGENLDRVRAAGLESKVFPLRAEAHELPFADGFFDAAVSLDAYHYFGTDDFYAAYLARFLKPRAPFGFVVPGLTQELEDVPPPELQTFWEPALYSFHAPVWWRRHLERSGAFDVKLADLVPDGHADWHDWVKISLEHGEPLPFDPTNEVTRREFALLEADAGRLLGFSRVVANRL